MAKEDLIRMFPTKRVSPFDGMAVTAQVWAEAHEVHRQQQQLYALLGHGPGILVGLEVIASDPPDSAVYVLPGIAMDPHGQIIVVHEPVAYDIGQARGLLYLVLTYSESRPRAGQNQEGGPLYVHAEFGVEARSDAPASAHVELARVRREDRNAPLTDARDPAHPGPNEIDLRFRQEIGAASHPTVSIGVAYADGKANPRHARGASALARALRHAGPYRVWANEGISLGAGLESLALVYLVAQDAFELRQSEMQALYAYLQDGGTVLMESCRQDHAEGDPPSDAAFSDLLASLGVRLDALPSNHSLLTQPHLFAAPPAGFETNGSPQISLGREAIGEGVILSTSDYGCLWQGERREQVASREDIRTATEWGTNIIAYAIGRRRAGD